MRRRRGRLHKLVSMVGLTLLPLAGPWLAVEAGAGERLPELRVAQIGNPGGLDCWTWTSVDEQDIMRHFVEPLFEFDREGRLHGVVAESMEMQSPTEWVIHVRQGLKFHDPEYGELQAEDVVASLDTCAREGARSASALPASLLKHQATVVDPYTVRLTMPEPGTAVLPNVSVTLFISPKKYLELGRDKVARRPIGTGPYKFVEWTPNVRIVVERFEGYWGPAQHIDRIVWRIIPDAFTRKAEFLSGGIDVLAFVQPAWVSEITANPNTHVESVRSGRYIFIVPPVDKPPFNDKRVRQALNYAVNKQELVDQLFLGIGAFPMTGGNHSILPETDPNRVGYPYDPKKARQLLDEARAAGVKIGKITLYGPNDRYTLDKEMGEAVAGYWQAIGLEVEYVHQPRSVLFPKILGLQFHDPYLIGWGNIQMRVEYPYVAPVLRYGASPIPAEWDQLINALGTSVDGDPRRVEWARKLDQLWTEDARWVFMINYIDLYGVSNRVDWKPFPIENRYFLDAKPRVK